MKGTNRRPLAPGDDPGRTTIPASVDDWLASFSRQDALGHLLSASVEEQLLRGYGHTLREILQQPVTWIETAARMRELRPRVEESLAGVEAVVFTGSGSSVYAAECVAPWLQGVLGLPVSAVPAGLILTHPESCLPPAGRFLVVSLARSGNSPESRAVVDSLIEERPQARHLLITCNAGGALATSYRGRDGVRTIVLDERTHDRSLVMTSSFTNLVLAGRALAGRSQALEERARSLARTAAGVLRDRVHDLAATARSRVGSVVYLGSGCRLGSARESALKMTEMNAGEVWSYAESYLGLRHGPMSSLRPETLVVAFLSSDPLVRAYERDLLTELDRKSLGARRVIVGADVPSALASSRDTVVLECGSRAEGADEDLVLLDALVGQLLAFFRCLDAGYRPDSPSEDGVITRVVSGFEIHRRDGASS
ncbi:MAG TPA: tagatose-6-phosphate ketose isomerase [Vicinamibacteria bacterium]|nr:tagatose-6-phosphate ketose isomerase [Vicinamibacteria bacterium]